MRVFKLKKTGGEIEMNLVAVIQARMGSQRFPGKVLAIYRDKPVLDHVLAAAQKSLGKQNVVLATSKDEGDDVLAEFAVRQGWKVYRGSQENVWSRFQEIAKESGKDWIVRISADSPLISSALIGTLVSLIRSGLDIVTNIHPRTFPHGQSVEIIHRRLFFEKQFYPKTKAEREHVSSHYYRIPELRILNHPNPKGDQSSLAWSVEEPGDIERLEKLWQR